MKCFKVGIQIKDVRNQRIIMYSNIQEKKEKKTYRKNPRSTTRNHNTMNGFHYLIDLNTSTSAYKEPLSN